MSEEESKQEDAVQETAQPDDLLSRANLAAERLERANSQTLEILKRQEALQVQATLGGVSSAGVPQKKESEQEYAARVLRGDV
jgi:hypothetical protein